MRALTINPQRTILLAALLVGVCATAEAAVPVITVTAGQALQLKGQSYGPGAVDGLTHDLAHTVGAALSRSKAVGAPSQVRLVLQDASPSRMLEPDRAQRDVSLGGAWIDGFVIGGGGEKTPLGFSYYRSGLGPREPGPWGDAHRAFSTLAADLAHGRVPQQAAPGNKPPASEAHYPE